MKFISIFLIFCSTLIFAQEPPLGWSNSEVFFITTGLGAQETIHYHAEPIGARWDADNTSPPSNFDLTTDYGEGWYPDENDPGRGNVVTSPIITYYATTWGFDFINATPIINDYTLAYGVYRISIVENGRDAYFFLDYRDTRFRTYDITQGSGIDVWFIYDGENDQFGYRRYSCPITIDPEDFIDITDGDYLPIWEIKEQSGGPYTSGFESHWSNALVGIDDGDNHPKIVWGPYPGELAGTLKEYWVYAASHNHGQPPVTFNKIAEVEDDVWEYVDNTVEIGTGYNDKTYYVKAMYEDAQREEKTTSATNSITYQLTIPDKINLGYLHNKLNSTEYGLEQNHPNPFNPATRIDYSLKYDGIVNLVIYDVLGREITTLVNENKPAGNYSVEFNAGDLPSGIYFYNLKAGTYTEIKKMLLLK